MLYWQSILYRTLHEKRLLSNSYAILKTAAQTFEGMVTWSIRKEITDPQMKARMEMAKKEMQIPEKIKERQESMEDPQVRTMIEQNPPAQGEDAKSAFLQALRNVEGVPFKVVNWQQGNATIEASELKRQTLKADELVISPGYTRTEGDSVSEPALGR